MTQTLFGNNKELPGEIIALILHCLSGADLMTISMINRAWNKLCRGSKDYNKRWWKICMDEWYILF